MRDQSRDPSITASTYSHEFEKVARSDERRDRIETMYGATREKRKAIAVAR